MPWNILILPFIAWYLFLTRTNKFIFKHERLESNRLIIESAWLWFLMLGFLYIIKEFLFCFEFFRSIRAYLPYFDGMPHFWLCLGCIPFALILSKLWNKHSSSIDTMKESLNNHWSALEKIILSSFIDNKSLLFTLKDWKFYVAFALATPHPNNELGWYISVLPILSWYRDENKELRFTTNYSSVYYDTETELDLVICVDEIISVRYFEEEVYTKFHKKHKIPVK